MFFLIFLKLFPVMAIAEVKELEIHEQDARTRGRTDAARCSASSTDRARRRGGAAAAATAASASSRSTRRRRFDEVDDAVIAKPSRVRCWTLIGGLTGVVTGYALTIWMANNWPIMVGGKPYSSIPPYTIIAFELTILFGGILTLLGLFVVGRLPTVQARPGATARASLPRSSGSSVSCTERDVAEIDGLLRAHHAKEVSLVEA